MEYSYGTHGKTETLRTKGKAHTDLKGWHEIVREYPDQIITDRFRVVRKTGSDTDLEGNCYDWYEIDNHYRVQDKTLTLKAEAEDIDQMAIDHEMRLTMLELGLNE